MGRCLVDLVGGCSLVDAVGGRKAGGRKEEEGKRSGYSTKHKNPTRQCVEKSQRTQTTNTKTSFRTVPGAGAASPRSR